LKGIDFIEQRLKDDLSVFAVATMIGYSFYHFSRLFHGITGFAPKSYILRRRLTEASRELRETDKKIIDIAFDYQFGNHESFSRAFRNFFGMNPMAYRKGKALGILPLVPRITGETLIQTDKMKDLQPEIITLPKIQLAGFPTFFKETDDGRIIGELWVKFLKEMPRLTNRIVPERYYQVQYWSANEELGGWFFLIAVEVGDMENIPPLFSAKLITSARYLRFVHRGLPNRVGDTYKYIYNQWLPNTDYRLPHPFNFELCGDRYKGPDNEDSESDIFIPIGEAE
jgi:AraC family transcriptional regulator